MTPDERAVLMEGLADELERRGEQTAALVTGEIGQPTGFSQFVNIALPTQHLRYFAAMIRDFAFEERRSNISGPGTSVVRWEPVGVAGLITPWNYPQSILSAKLAPALAVGCTVVVKPAGETPLDALALTAAVEAVGFPPGVVNVVTGGRETGEALVRHPGVDKIAFTGSTAAGRLIARTCGERLIPVTLELGGKSAAIVTEDADLDVTLAGLRAGAFMNSGQTCFLLSRVLVPRTRKDEMLDGLVELARSFRLGDPRDPATDMGPLVSERIRGRVRTMVDDARGDGAEILTGGRDLPGQRGYFYEPTIVTGVDPDAQIAREEVFGPVVTVFEASVLGCGTITGAGAAIHAAGVTAGDTVAVIGLGGVGLNVVSGARLVGAARIIGIDLNDEKLELARAFGATDGVNAGEGDVVARVRELNGGGVDHAFEVIGRRQTVEQAIAMLRVGGTASLIGIHPAGGTFEVDANTLLREQKKVNGVYMGSSNIKRDIPFYASLFLQGRLDLSDLIASEIALDDINSAYAALHSGKTARTVITRF